MRADTLDRTPRYVVAVEQAMLAELDEWCWESIPQLRRILEKQIRQKGKRLRPLLALAFGELYGATAEEIVIPAASVELYHLASLILDDVQDNSAVRRGNPTLHTTATTSTAINVALVTRSLSYHPIHRTDRLTPHQKLRLRQELDLAATQLVFGQSIDIGWNDGWYLPTDFPYHDMVRWKTGSLFGCAAAMAAVICGADDAVDAAREFGVSFGSLFQEVDDYLDVFGDGQALRRPRLEDFRGGKLTAPLLRLVDALSAAGQADATEQVARRLAEHTADDQHWLLELMDRHAVADLVRTDLSRQAVRLCQLLPAEAPSARTAAVTELVDRVMARAGIRWRPAVANLGPR